MSVADRFTWTTLGVVQLIREEALTRSLNLATSPFTVIALWGAWLIISCFRRARGGKVAAEPNLLKKQSSPLCVLRDALEAALSEAALSEKKQRRSLWCRSAKRVSVVAVRAGTKKACEHCSEKAAHRPMPLPPLLSEENNDVPVVVACGDQRSCLTARLPILQRLQLPCSETNSDNILSHASSMPHIFDEKRGSRHTPITVAGDVDQQRSVKDPMTEHFGTIPDNRQQLKRFVRAHRATSAPPMVLGSALDSRSTR